MKKVFLFTTAVILLISIFSSCKKDKAQTTAQKVQHKWAVVSIIDNSHDATGDYADTLTGTSDDFMNFSSNGTATIQIQGQSSPFSYSIISDSQILLATETYTIETLTDAQLVLYVKDVISSTEYDEETINLKR